MRCVHDIWSISAMQIVSVFVYDGGRNIPYNFLLYKTFKRLEVKFFCAPNKRGKCTFNSHYLILFQPCIDRFIYVVLVYLVLNYLSMSVQGPDRQLSEL